MVNVVISGTFDRLHKGHELLLNKGIMEVACGETEVGELNHLRVEVMPWDYVYKFKKHAQIVQRESDRFAAVETYLYQALEPHEYTVVISNDEYGSAFYSSKLDKVVVGTDTIGWAAMLNFYRERNGLKPLEVIVAPDYMVGDKRISSTMLREKELNPELGFI